MSGESESGKSFLFHAIRAWIKEELTNMRVAVCAPTAYNVQGLTIHRLFQLPVEHESTPKYRPLSNDVLQILQEELKDVIFFNIDED